MRSKFLIPAAKLQRGTDTFGHLVEKNAKKMHFFFKNAFFLQVLRETPI